MAVNVLKLAEVARLLRLSEDGVRDLVRAGKLPAFKVGRSLRFDREAVLAAVGYPGSRDAGPGEDTES
jgi:excisionase family DNA binding protein